MEMQQDGSLKSAVQEALGEQVGGKQALEQRLQQLLDSSPVMLFMKVTIAVALMLQSPTAAKPQHTQRVE